MQITKKNLEKLKQELEELKKNRRAIALRIQSAKELGDLSENAEYSEAKEAQALNEANIAELEKKVRGAIIIKSVKSNKVQIGTVLKVRSAQDTQEFTIVGSNESNPAEGKISDESPLGKAFLGHQAGDTIEAELPNKKVKYKILEIK